MLYLALLGYIVGVFGDEELVTTGSKTGQLTMNICDVVTCPVAIKNSNGETIKINPDLSLDINWRANFFSCQIDSMRVTGHMGVEEEWDCAGWGNVKKPELFLENGDVNPQDGGGGWTSALHGNWTFGRQAWYDYLCWVEYSTILIHKKNELSCDHLKAKLNVRGWGKRNWGKYQIPEQTIGDINFGPWFSTAFPEITEGYDKWGNQRRNSDRGDRQISIVESLNDNKFKVVGGVAGLSFIVALGMLVYTKKKIDPLHV